MRDKRRLNMDQIKVLFLKTVGKPDYIAITHHPVFGIHRQIARGYADNTLFIRRFSTVGRRHQCDFMSELFELLAESLYRGGYTVDSGKINIGYHQNAHSKLSI